MKKAVIIGGLVLLLIGACYLQFGRKAQVVNTYKTSHGNTCTYILNVSLNALYVSRADEEEIYREICDLYGRRERCDQITICLFRSRYALKHGKVLSEAVYRSPDLMEYNTMDHPEQFTL